MLGWYYTGKLLKDIRELIKKQNEKTLPNTNRHRTT